jgi:hypothetical protein
LLDQALGHLAIREIKRRGKLRRRNADQASAELLGQLAGEFKAGVVRLVERQTDHDGGK